MHQLPRQLAGTIHSRSYHTCVADGILCTSTALLGSGRWADVTFVAEDQAVSAHRFILSCRSSYFAAMFGSGLRESQAGGDVLQDVEVCITTLPLLANPPHMGCARLLRCFL